MTKEYDVVPSNLENNVKKKVNVTIANSTGINVLRKVEVKTIHNETSFTLISIKNQIYPIFKKNNQDIFQEKRTFTSQEAGIGAVGAFFFALSFLFNVIQASSEIEVEIGWVNLAAFAIIGGLCIFIFQILQQINTTELFIKKELDHYLPYSSLLSSNEFVRDTSQRREAGVKPIKAFFACLVVGLFGLGLGFSNYVSENTYETVSAVENIVIYALSSIGILMIMSVLIRKSIREDVVTENYISDVSLVANLKDKKDLNENDNILDIGIAIQVPIKRNQVDYENAKELLEKKYKDKVVVGLEPYSNYKSVTDSISINNLDYTRLIAHIYKEKINEKKIEDNKVLNDKNLDSVMKNNIDDLIVYEAYLNSKKNGDEDYQDLIKDFTDDQKGKLKELSSDRVIDIIFELLNVNKSFGKSLSFLNSNYEILKSRNEQLLLDNTKLQTVQSLITTNNNANKVQNTDYSKKGWTWSTKTWVIAILVASLLLAGVYYYFHIYDPNAIVDEVVPE